MHVAGASQTNRANASSREKGNGRIIARRDVVWTFDLKRKDGTTTMFYYCWIPWNWLHAWFLSTELSMLTWHVHLFDVKPCRVNLSV
jgi:hypothetical protein